MRYIYNIAELNILINLPFELKLQEESLDFIKTAEDSEDTSDMIPFRFYPVPFISNPYNMHSVELRKYKECKNEIKTWFYSSPDSLPYAIVEMKFEPHKIDCYYLSDMVNHINYTHNIIELIGLETLLTAYNGFMLHASFIRWNDSAILFSAPSGTGKSTQASLWKTFENAEIINGDKTGIRYLDGKWKCYGLPNAGSSGIFRNESAPLKTVVILEQAPENSIRRLAPSEAFGYIYNQSLVHNWDSVFTEHNIDTIMKLIEDIPVYMLSCLPDQGAVNILKEKLKEL